MTDAMRNTKDPIVIVSAARTPMAGFQGEFASLTSPQLGSVAIAAALDLLSNAACAASPRRGMLVDATVMPSRRAARSHVFREIASV